ncbi:hypothetical protein WJX74_009945 [Apatococcus lobatus]|uniref:DUF1764-domain-containing protein n=1 Tax=Apatococcus lobatus TaxID=904363 RepID=A0AAW1S488_9CHLO
MKVGACKAIPKEQKTEDTSATVSTGTKVPQKSARKEIDDLFKRASTKKRGAAAEQDLKTTPAKVQRTKAVPKPLGSKEDLFATGTATTKLRRQDDEGLPIYSPEELNLGRGGETGDCPFDCSCCF